MNRQKRNGAMSLLLGVVVMMIGLLVLLASVVLKDWMTIGFGVRTLNLVRSIGRGVTIGGVILTALLSIPIVRGKMQRQREQRRQSQFINDYAGDEDNPELTRQMLEKLRREQYYFDDIVTRCLGQMDRMDRLQERQASLLEANAALYLSETEETLNRVERRLCRNMRNIINLCMAVDHPGMLDSRKLSRIFDDNERKLRDSGELIRVSVERINRYINEHDDSSDEVQRWIDTICESLKEEN